MIARIVRFALPFVLALASAAYAQTYTSNNLYQLGVNNYTDTVSSLPGYLTMYDNGSPANVQFATPSRFIMTSPFHMYLGDVQMSNPVLSFPSAQGPNPSTYGTFSFDWSGHDSNGVFRSGTFILYWYETKGHTMNTHSPDGGITPAESLTVLVGADGPVTCPKALPNCKP